jgi:hypothetical protein
MRRALRIPVVAASVLATTASAYAVGGARQSHSEGSCTADATKALVRTFARSYSGGRIAEIDRWWAREPRFRWFSANAPGARLGPAAYDRATLRGYFRARVRLHERIWVTRLRAGYDREHHVGHFSGKLVRSADDLRARVGDFKGGADCFRGRLSLIVWSM